MDGAEVCKLNRKKMIKACGSYRYVTFSMSFPLQVRVYIGVFTDKHNEYYDLIVLRLLSMNSVVDPWIFIICRTSNFHRHLGLLCNQLHAGNKPCWKTHVLKQSVSL